MNSIKELQELIDTGYIPNSMERKKAVLMYFFVWIIVWLSSKKTNKYEIFHLKQSLWWWMLFFITFIVSIALFFIPYVRVLPVLIFVFEFWIWVFFVRQAWMWEYLSWSNQKIFMPIFQSIWWWIIEMFEIQENDNN